MNNKKIEFLSKYAKGGNLVLSTSKDDIVTSRMVSVILVEDSLYFTSVKRDGNTKNEQIQANPNVALCDNSLQMTANAEILGLITDPHNKEILEQYKSVLPKSYEMFGHHECLLIKLDIKTLKDFSIKDGKPEVINLTFNN